jgi:hypothetical protein
MNNNENRLNHVITSRTATKEHFCVVERFFPRIFVFVFLIEPFYIIVTELDKLRHVANCERGAKATILVNKVT